MEQGRPTLSTVNSRQESIGVTRAVARRRGRRSTQKVSRLLRVFLGMLVFLQYLRISEGRCAPPLSLNAASARSGSTRADGLYCTRVECGADPLSIWSWFKLDWRRHTFADAHTPNRLLSPRPVNPRHSFPRALGRHLVGSSAMMAIHFSQPSILPWRCSSVGRAADS